MFNDDLKSNINEKCFFNGSSQCQARLLKWRLNWGEEDQMSRHSSKKGLWAKRNFSAGNKKHYGLFYQKSSRYWICNDIWGGRCMDLVQTHKCSLLIMGPHIFQIKVASPKFIIGCHMVWDAIWGTSCFYKSKIEEAKWGGKSAILPNWFCRQSITVLSTTQCLFAISVSIDY